MLEDDQHAFPPYECAAVVNQSTAQAHPELLAALALLDGRINDSTMTALNYEVDHLKRSPEEVAQLFLASLQLPPPAQRTGIGTITIGSKLFTEQYILVELFRQLIEQQTSLTVDPKPGLGGTKICFEALKTGEIDLYPEYSGTGFQVLLSPPDSLREAIFTDADGVYDYVRDRCAEEHKILWQAPLGFNNTYALMTRNELARQMGWSRISDLNQ